MAGHRRPEIVSGILPRKRIQSSVFCPAEGTSGRRPMPAAILFSNRASDTSRFRSFTMPGGVEAYAILWCAVGAWLCIRNQNARIAAGFIEPLVLDYSKSSKQLRDESKECRINLA